MKRDWKCISHRSRHLKVRADTYYQWESAGIRRRNVTNRSTGPSKISSENCPRWTLRSRRFVHERHRPTRRRHDAPATQAFRLEPNEDARFVRHPRQGDDVSGTLDSSADGAGRGTASTDHWNDYGPGARIAAYAFDSERIFARTPLTAFFDLCAAQPPRFGTLLPDPGRRDACQGIFLLLDQMDTDRSFSRD